MTLRAYQAWEAAGGIAWENYARLAKAFNVSEEYLLYGVDEPRPSGTQMDRIERKLDELLKRTSSGAPVPDETEDLSDAEAAKRLVTETARGAAQRLAGTPSTSEGSQRAQGGKGGAR